MRPVGCTFGEWRQVDIECASILVKLDFCELR